MFGCVASCLCLCLPAGRQGYKPAVQDIYSPEYLHLWVQIVCVYILNLYSLHPVPFINALKARH